MENYFKMITANKMWHDESGAKRVAAEQMGGFADACKMATEFFYTHNEACRLDIKLCGNGSFCVRVLSKKKLLYKIQYSKS